MPELIAWFSITGGGYASTEVDAGWSPDELATLAENAHPGVSLCHQCAHEISDPEPELMGFRVGGREYGRDTDGAWCVVSDDAPTEHPGGEPDAG